MSQYYYLKLNLKAAALAAAFCFSADSIAKPASVNSVKDAAERLFLQKNRKSAIEIIRQAVKGSTAGGNKEDLMELAAKLATLFLTDKGQKLYEQAQTHLFDSPRKALELLNEARELEASHVGVELAIVRAGLLLNDCDGAGRRLTETETIAFAVKDWWELRADTLLCLKAGDELEKHLKAWAESMPEAQQSAVFHAGKAYKDYSAGEFAKALRTLQEAPKAAAGDPILLYWRYRTLKELDLSRESEARKLVRVCRETKAALKRKIINSPQICLHREELEAYLREMEAGEEAVK